MISIGKGKARIRHEMKGNGLGIEQQSTGSNGAEQIRFREVRRRNELN